MTEKRIDNEDVERHSGAYQAVLGLLPENPHKREALEHAKRAEDAAHRAIEAG